MSRLPPADENGDIAEPFAHAARRYRSQGWRGTLPLPPNAKEQPPTGFTGHGAPYPNDRQVDRWLNANPDGNICLRLGEVSPGRLRKRDDLVPIYAGNNVDGWELIGIDVDDYGEKHGAQQLAELEAELGPLPETVVSSARWETSPVSGTRILLVPKGFNFRGKACATGHTGPKHIDILCAGLRYLVVWPSVHPTGTTYEFRWGRPGEALKTYTDVPHLDDVAMLPEQWFKHLQVGMSDGADAKSDMGFGELQEWAEATFRDCDGEPCTDMANKLAQYKAELDLSDSHHPMNDVVWSLTKNALEGHAGWHTALNDYLTYWRDLSLSKRDEATLNAEAMRSVDGALAKAKAKYDERHGYMADDKCVGGHGDVDAFAKMVDAVPDPPRGSNGRYCLVLAAELAEPVEPMRWLVRGIWPERSAGVLAGDKKSMKTWNLQALALAVAAGTALFGKYHVTSSGAVLYLSGEGGRNTFANRHQVLAKRYGINEKVLRELPLGAEFGVGMLTDKEFTDAVKRHLDELQPALVILDPLYAYHPSDVEAQNVYARGPMLADLRTMIGDEAALIVGDHFNKSANGQLDLANIAQAGMAQWADSWILQKHRETPNIDENKFWLEVMTGTRRGGGKHLEVDWTLERDNSDPDVIAWTGVDWEARPFERKSAANKVDGTTAAILQAVADNPFELTVTKVLEKVGGNRDKARKAFAALKANGGIVVKECAADERGRQITRPRVGLGDNAEALRNKRFKREQVRAEPDADESTDTDDGTGCGTG